MTKKKDDHIQDEDLKKMIEEAEQEAGKKEASSPIDELTELREQNKALEDKFLRLQAEFMNFKKRSQEELMASRERATDSCAEKFLNILDSLPNLREHLPEEVELRKGLEGFLKMVENYAQELHITQAQIIPKETAFNPEEHEAIGSEEQQGMTDKILEVYQRGYKRGDKVLRTAKVKVGS